MVTFVLRHVLEIAKNDVYLCHARLSVRMEQLGFHWTDFHEIWYLSIFRKSLTWIKVSLKSDNNNGYFTWGRVYIYDNTSRISCWNEKYFGKSCREIKNIRFVFSDFFFKSFLIWDVEKNIVQPDRPQMTIRRMRIAFWISKATDTHSECVILTAFPLQQRLHECAVQQESCAAILVSQSCLQKCSNALQRIVLVATCRYWWMGERNCLCCLCQVFFRHWAKYRGEFRPRQTRQLPRAVDLKGRFLSCQSY